MATPVPSDVFIGDYGKITVQTYYTATTPTTSSTSSSLGNYVLNVTEWKLSKDAKEHDVTTTGDQGAYNGVLGQRKYSGSLKAFIRLSNTPFGSTLNLMSATIAAIGLSLFVDASDTGAAVSGVAITPKVEWDGTVGDTQFYTINFSYVGTVNLGYAGN